MKNFFLLVLLSLSFVGFSQNLDYKIPSDALMVASIDGKHLQDFISVTEFNQYDFVKKLFVEASNDNKNISSIKDFGFDVNSDAYYFMQKDSVSYHNFMVKLSSKAAFESLLSESELERVSVENGISMIVEHDEVFMWNDKMLFLTHAEYPSKPYDYNAYEDNEVWEETVVEEVESDETVLELSENEEMEEYEVIESTPRIEDSEEEVIEVEERETPPPAPDASNFSGFENDANDILKNRALDFFNNTNTKSIVLNTNYTKGKDKDAVAYFWISNYGLLVSSFMDTYKALLGNAMYANMNLQDLYGIDAVKINFFIEEDAFKMKGEVDLSANRVDMFKNIYDSKLDKAFLKYFNQDDALAYLSSSIDSQAALEEFPALYTSIMKAILPDFNEEVSLGAEFLAILLDEEAIAKLITGDVLFILNDLSEKEIEYTTYEYDDDWNSTEVTKTKNEFVPDFTLMLGSQNTNFINKLIRLGAKHKVIDLKNSYSEVTVPNMPFKIFLLQKDGIFFVSTSQKDMANIVADRFVANTGKHKKLMRKNIMAFYVNSDKITTKVPAENMSESDLDILKYAQESFGEVYMTSARIKGDKMYSEYVLKTKGKKGNALKTVFDFIEKVAK